MYSTIPKTSNYTPCAGMHLFLSLSHINKEPQPGNKSLFTLYFNLHVKVEGIIMHYDFADMDADIGGSIGLFLGISFIDLGIKCNSLVFSHITKKFK